MTYPKWESDILGNYYECATIKHPDDYAGNVRSSIIRRKTNKFSNKAILYIHGFSDYYLQAEFGEICNEHGYNFYAVDLRKYGRSYISGQQFFQVRNLDEYFPDIQAAVDLMKLDGIKECALLGHSTGGLTASLYMSRHPDSLISVLLLNSPFLAWNLPWYLRLLIPVIALIGRFFPNIIIPQPKDTRYAQSLRKIYGGEWEYNPSWKPDQLPDVDAAWIRAIETGQRQIRKGANIKVPILVLTSSRSAKNNDSMDVFRNADAVLDIKKISSAAHHLGTNVTIKHIKNGLHDLALSNKSVRNEYYHLIFDFLKKNE